MILEVQLERLNKEKTEDNFRLLEDYLIQLQGRLEYNLSYLHEEITALKNK